MTPTRPEPVHLDPDPLHFPEEEVRRYQPETPEQRRRRHRRGYLAIGIGYLFAAVVVILAILAAALLAIPRSGPDPTTSVTPTPAQTEVSQSALEGAPGPLSHRHSLAGVTNAKPTGYDVATDLREAPHPTAPALLPDTATEVVGTASWFCGGGSACTRGVPPGSYAAAAGPALRVGDWRGRIVKVCAGSRCVRVALRDWCACPRRVIDLYRLPFSKLASPSRGVIRVSVTWGGASAPLPPTSTK